MSETRSSNYRLTGPGSAQAVQQGLAGATWYASPLPKGEMRALLERKDGPALRDTALWFGLLCVTGFLGGKLWGTWWALGPFALYGVLYASTSDARWHEAGHGTAFRTDWLNNALYEIASFMILRESVPWRWSHARHHSDTIIVGRDPEIAVPRPPDLAAMAMSFFNLKTGPAYVSHVLRHCTGRLTAEEKTYIPASEHGLVCRNARIYLTIYLAVIATALWTRSWLPLMYIGLPNLYGAWLGPVYGYTQHAGLAENVLDHRLNCRTIRMNRLNRFLYWNMNFHLEHHMFPLVPYHALPRLHALIKDDCPPPYASIWDAYREIVPAVLRQVKDPTYHVQRVLPAAVSHVAASPVAATDAAVIDGWVDVGAATGLGCEGVLRFDHADRTFAVYRADDGRCFATDGMCTHGNAHLADGFVRGRLIECPKHNGRFDITDGSPQRRPACVALRTHPVRELDGRIFLRIDAMEQRV